MQEGITPASSLIAEPIASTQWVPAQETPQKKPRLWRKWSDEEEAAMRKHYPLGGYPACRDVLPIRNERQIRIKAQKMGLRSPRHRPRQSFTSNQFIDDAIARTIKEDGKRGMYKRLERRIHRPRRWIAYRAQQLGLVEPKGGGLPWSQREIELAVANAAKKPVTISLLLKRHGFKRTPGAVYAKLNLMHVDRTDDDHYTGIGLAALMGVQAHKVAGWIEKGWLVARRNPVERSRYSIHRKNVRRFIVENVGHVDIKRCDKVWLVELLAGSSDFG